MPTSFQVFGVHLTNEADEDEDSQDEGTENQENWVTVQDLKLPYHLRCSAHTLALSSTSDVLKIIKSNPEQWNLHKTSIEKCNVLWKFSNRPKSAEIMQSVMGKTLSRPTETRWNSLYDSLKQVVDARPFMEELKVRLNISQVGTCTFIFSNK